jgi:hypothetical protein
MMLCSSTHAPQVAGYGEFAANPFGTPPFAASAAMMERHYNVRPM